MANYSPIQLSNLHSIRQQVLRIVPKYVALDNKSKFFYSPQEEIRAITELWHQLESLGLAQYLCATGINLCYHTPNPKIHTDTGDYIHSLNIPIAGYQNTFISFWQSNSATKLLYHGNISYYGVDTKNCVMIEKHETVVPAIVNTSVLHCFENPNSEARTILLLRLSKGASSSIWEDPLQAA